MTGAGLAQMDMDLVKFIVNAFKIYYPNLLSWLLVYNMPWILQGTHSLSLIHTLTHSHTRSLIHTLTHTLTDTLTHSHIHSFTHSLIHPLTHTLTHSHTAAWKIVQSWLNERAASKVK